MKRLVLAALLVLLAASRFADAGKLNIQPGQDVPPYQFVKMTAADGVRVFVQPLPKVDQIPTPVTVVQAADGSLLWVAPPGIYLIFWFDLTANDQGQTYVRILGSGPQPNPDPQPNSGFEKAIATALAAIGKPPSRTKVAAVYRAVAEEANVRRDLWKPALMVDEAKKRITSTLTVSELSTWVPFWPKFNDAAKALQLDASDTDAFITMFRTFATVLEK